MNYIKIEQYDNKDCQHEISFEPDEFTGEALNLRVTNIQDKTSGVSVYMDKEELKFFIQNLKYFLKNMDDKK